MKGRGSTDDKEGKAEGTGLRTAPLLWACLECTSAQGGGS